jgi:mannose-1-phosphate guanylyltransferase
MHAILFAGGVGQRLWPLSRKNSPKQFLPLIGDQSSLQLAVARLLPLVPIEQIYIATNYAYHNLIREQLPSLPIQNIILEPARRDLAAATAWAFYQLQARGVRGPLIIKWADNYVKDNAQFQTLIKAGEQLVTTDPHRIIFIAQTPRYANEQLGYIEHGEEVGSATGLPYYGFKSWTYRPDLETCKRMLAAGNFVWNTGYFVTTVEFLLTRYRQLAPEVTNVVEVIMQHAATPQFQEKLNTLYPTIPKLHFDEAFLMRLKPHEAVIFKGDLQWSDPGTLYALKEDLVPDPDSNLTHGESVVVHSRDSLVHNSEAKTVSVLGMDGVIVVNTPDALLVTNKEAVGQIKKLLEELEQQGKSDIL